MKLTPRQQLAAAERSGLELAYRRDLRCRGLVEPAREVMFAESLGRKWRLDFGWLDVRLGVEIDGATYAGGRHTRGKGYEEDCTKLNSAVLLGWQVLRFTRRMIESGEAGVTTEQALHMLADQHAR